MRHRYQKRKIVLQIRAILINGTRGTQKWNTSNLQLFPTGINSHQGFSRIKDTKKSSKILSRKPLLNVHYTATVRSFSHCSSAGWLCPCKRGWRYTGSRKYWTARFWDGATLGGGLLGCASFGASANEISTKQLGCAQMGNAVKDQCHSERRSVAPRIMWVVAAWVGAHLGCALQRVTLVYRRAKKWRSTGYKPLDIGSPSHFRGVWANLIQRREAPKVRMTPMQTPRKWLGERASRMHLRHESRDLQKKKKPGRNLMPTPPGLFDLGEHQRDRAPRPGFLPRSFEKLGIAGV